ncbi:MAG: tyrosine-type recombinase/integrase [Chthoniobacter sp.]
MLERATGESLPFHTTEGFLQNWLRGKQVAKSASTFKNYGAAVSQFLAHLGGRAKLGIAAINPKDISAFRDAEIASGKNPNSIRGRLEILRIPFNAARRQGILTTNPVEAVELPGITKDGSGEKTSRHPFSAEQVAALLRATTARENAKSVFNDENEWQGAILFSYYTGTRIGDTVNLAWSAIDLPAKLLTYRAQKTGKLVRVPLHPELEAYLLELSAPDSGKALVFPTLARYGTGTRTRRFATIMERAGVANAILSPSRGTKGRTVNAYSFHSLRHSFNSAMANAGVSQEIRKKLTGHTSDIMNSHYTHHEIEPLRAAINAIPSIGSAN